MITAALAATIAGALSVGGAKWAEEATERDAQLATVAYEQRLLAANPEEELAELVEHYTDRGLTPDLAREVAEQLHAADPLAAQLQTEYGIDEIPSARAPVLTGLGAGISFAVGSSIPLLITFVGPDLPGRDRGAARRRGIADHHLDHRRPLVLPVGSADDHPNVGRRPGHVGRSATSPVWLCCRRRAEPATYAAGGSGPMSCDRRLGPPRMRTLAITQNMTLDGVIDLTDDWFAPASGDDQLDVLEALRDQDYRADATLLGRQTFEDFRGYWPLQTDDRTGITAYLNRVTKYVVTSTLTDPAWENSVIVPGPAIEAVAALKETDGRDIVCTGSITLTHALLRPGWSMSSGCSSSRWSSGAVGGWSPTA